MKLLHTSDWHLGAHANEYSLIEDQKFFIDDICRIIAENEIEGVMIAGDVYDRSVSSTEAVALYDYAMTRLINELGVKVFMIAGNHDSAERLSNMKDVVARSGCYIVGALSENITPICFNDVEIYMLPWITEEKVKSVFPDRKDSIKDTADAYRAVADAMRSTFTEGKKHILIAHAFITNAETSTSDRSAVIGLATQVPASVFEGFDYVALGHIHKPQDVNEKVRYCGTPMAYSFGREEKQEKSVTIIDTSDMSKTIVPLKQLHVRKTVSGTYEEIMNSEPSEEEKNGYIRVEITNEYITSSIIFGIKTLYPNYIEVSGKTYESEGAVITLSIEELEKKQSDPVEIFRAFCNDEMKESASDHWIDLFEKAVGEVERKTADGSRED